MYKSLWVQGRWNVCRVLGCKEHWAYQRNNTLLWQMAGVLHISNFLEEKILLILTVMGCVLHRDFLQMYTIRQWEFPAYWDKSEALNLGGSVKPSYNKMHNLKLNGVGETSFLLWNEAAFIVFPWNSKIHLMGKKLVNTYTRRITAGTYCLL